jgi:hypothetical protein
MVIEKCGGIKETIIAKFILKISQNLSGTKLATFLKEHALFFCKGKREGFLDK